MAVRNTSVKGSTRNCIAEMYLNDVPLLLEGSGIIKDYERMKPAAAFLSEGSNVLTMLVGPGPTPNTARTEARPGAEKAAPGMKASVEFRTEIIGWGSVDLDIEWEAENEDPFPLVRSVTTDIDPGGDLCKWRLAEVLTWDDATKASAIEAAVKIRDAFVKGDSETVLAMLEHTIKETCQFDPEESESEMTEGIGGFIKENANSPSWKPAMLPPDDFDLRLVGGGRLVELVTKDWQAIVRMEEGGLFERILIGRLDGEWKILG